AIASDGGPGMLADLVGRLADKSLLASADAQGGRWRLLESVRAYALEQLAASGEEAAVRERHLRWAAETAVSLEGRAEADQEGRASFDQVADDLRAALGAAAGTATGTAAAAATGAATGAATEAATGAATGAATEAATDAAAGAATGAATVE